MELRVAVDGLLGIVYRLERVLTGEPDDSQLDVWWALLRRGTLVGEEDIAWEEIGAATLYGMHPDRNLLVGESPFDVADAYSADTAYYYEHVFDAAGDLLPDVEEAFEWAGGRALFLHDVRVPRPLRRRGYGSLLAADAILTLAPHGTAVFAHPGPTDLQTEDPEDVRQLRSETENTRFLAALGFVPFRDRLWALDLSAGEAMDTLARIRAGLLA
jgi:GNAT superfamily N-acetyltransferase